MMPAKAFIATFTDYLTSSARLPFVCTRPYNVAMIQEDKIVDNYNQGFDIGFDISVSDKQYNQGYIYVRPIDGPVPLLYIWSLRSPINRSLDREGFGRELLRRAVLFARENNFGGVQTSEFTGGKAPFWFGMGFNGDPQICLDWDRVRDVPEAAIWQKKMLHDTRALWDLARTEIGREVLKYDTWPGRLDFNNDIQRAYVAKRLKLEFRI